MRHELGHDGIWSKYWQAPTIAFWRVISEKDHGVADSSPQDRKEWEGKKLRGEEDKIKLVDFRFERE